MLVFVIWYHKNEKMKIVVSISGSFCLTYKQMQWLLGHNVQGHILGVIEGHFAALQAEKDRLEDDDDDVDITEYPLYCYLEEERTNPLLIQMVEECIDGNNCLEIREVPNSDRYLIRWNYDGDEYVEVPEQVKWVTNQYYKE